MRSESTNAEEFGTSGDPRFRCCCGCCDVRAGALLIAFFHSLGTGVALFQIAQTFLISRQEDPTWLPLSAFTLLLVFFLWTTLGLMGVFVGVCGERPGWLLPTLAFQILTLSLSLIGVLLCVLILAVWLQPLVVWAREKRWRDADGQGEPELETEAKVRGRVVLGLSLTIGGLVCSFLLQLWWFLVLRAAHRFLLDKSLWRKRREQAVSAAVPLLRVSSPPVSSVKGGDSRNDASQVKIAAEPSPIDMFCPAPPQAAELPDGTYESPRTPHAAPFMPPSIRI